MFRLLFLLLAVGLGFLIIRHLLRQARLPRREAAPKVADVVPCARCGLHVPRHEALERDGHFYCCTEHRDAGAS